MTVPVSAFNSDKDIADFLTEDILDEGLAPATIARFLSSGKNEIERLLKPEILIAEDSSKTRSVGDSYLSMKALPDDFREMLELYVGTTLYRPIPFQKRMTYRLSGLRYYIDHKNSQFAICGSAGAGETIRQLYLIKTDDFTEASVQDEDGDGTQTLTWPKEFWELCAWAAAEVISKSTDLGADDISFRMSAGQRTRKEELLHAFRMWDHDQKLASMDHRSGYGDNDDPSDEEILANM